MAHATQITSNTQSGLAARINALFAAYRERSERRRVFRQTFNELSALSNRELADLGLARTEIRRVAYQAAFQS